MDFFSMGMFCVDEIHTRTNSHTDIIGGAGTYAALGAGIVLPSSDRSKVGFICDEGHDFNRAMKQEINGWSMGTVFRHNPNRETTKAWNKFVNNEERLFKYLSPKLQIFAADLPAEARSAKVIHLICSPQRCAEFMADLKDPKLRPNQKFVWEPVPTECTPEQYTNLKTVVTEFGIDVLSPNALEAAACVGLPEPTTKEAVEQLDAAHYGFASTIVIRCGAMGSYLRTDSVRKWYPAYFETQQHRVVDPSGAGNAFTGGLGEALALELDWDRVMAYASVSSSFMIEQIGPPKYDPELDQWNGEVAADRIKNYMALLRQSKQNLAKEYEEKGAVSEASIEWSEEESSDEESPVDSNPSSPVLSAVATRYDSNKYMSPITQRNNPSANSSVNSDSHTDTPTFSAADKHTPPLPASQLSTSFQKSSVGQSINDEALPHLLDSDSLNSARPSGQFAEESKTDLPCNFDQDVIAEILCPPESMCNEKFSLIVDDSMFVGIPVHILESGTWRPLKDGYAGDETYSTDVEEPPSESHPPLPESPQPENGDEGDLTNHSADAKVGSMTSESSSKNGSSKNTETSASASTINAVNRRKLKGVVTEDDSPMRMFHVCFVCNPPINESSMCEQRIYEYALVPFVRTLRQEQASKNYVWNEVAKMQRISEMTSNLSPAERQEALEVNCELARALRTMCTAFANMEIARVMICNKPRAFQVPLQLELTQIPGWYDEVPPHAYLSTSNSATKEIGHDCYECYGLLLLGDPEVIVKEIDVDPQGPVAAMIRNIDPMSSLDELAKQNRIEIRQIVNLVWSLVYWRRARIIIPLNSRHTYCMSPLAPRESLNSLSRKFHDLFPVMPPLQRFLSLLSTSKPKPFFMHVPSTDHRSIYLRSLVWLLQNDLVVHLPTFAQIFITRKIKLASMNTEDEEMEDPLGSADKSRDRPKSEQPAAENKEVSDETIAEQLRRRKWMRRQSSSYHGDFYEIQESVILDPRHATVLEKRWLAQVAVSGLSRSPELAAMFQRLTKYFNKQDNLEQVMVYEKISREDMRRFLQEFSPYIITYRHW